MKNSLHQTLDIWYQKWLYSKVIVESITAVVAVVTAEIVSTTMTTMILIETMPAMFNTSAMNLIDALTTMTPIVFMAVDAEALTIEAMAVFVVWVVTETTFMVCYAITDQTVAINGIKAIVSLVFDWTLACLAFGTIVAHFVNGLNKLVVMIMMHILDVMTVQ